MFKKKKRADMLSSEAESSGIASSSAGIMPDMCILRQIHVPCRMAQRQVPGGVFMAKKTALSSVGEALGRVKSRVLFDMTGSAECWKSVFF